MKQIHGQTLNKHKTNNRKINIKQEQVPNNNEIHKNKI